MDDNEEHAIESCAPQFAAGMIRCMIDETRDLIPESEENELLRIYGMMINETLKTYMLVLNNVRFVDREKHIANIRETISETLDKGRDVEPSKFINHAWITYLKKILDKMNEE